MASILWHIERGLALVVPDVGLTRVRFTARFQRKRGQTPSLADCRTKSATRIRQERPPSKEQVCCLFPRTLLRSISRKEKKQRDAWREGSVGVGVVLAGRLSRKVLLDGNFLASLFGAGNDKRPKQETCALMYAAFWTCLTAVQISRDAPAVVGWEDGRWWARMIGGRTTCSEERALSQFPNNSSRFISDVSNSYH